MRQIPALALNRTILFAAGLVILGTIILTVWYIGGTTPTAPDTATPALEDDQGMIADDIAPDEAATPDRPAGENAPAAAEFAIVYISGAVQHPDVYQVPVAARVKDVVMAAGGLTEDAASDRVNLAEHIADAQHIHIPREGETSSNQAPTSETTTPGDTDKAVNINTASAADLDGLPGIGQAIALRIVEYRTANGPFQSVEDLRKVKGIGPALFANIASLVTVDP